MPSDGRRGPRVALVRAFEFELAQGRQGGPVGGQVHQHGANVVGRGGHPRGQAQVRGSLTGIGQHEQVGVAKKVERSGQLAGRREGRARFSGSATARRERRTSNRSLPVSRLQQIAIP